MNDLQTLERQASQAETEFPAPMPAAAIPTPHPEEDSLCAFCRIFLLFVLGCFLFVFGISLLIEPPADEEPFDLPIALVPLEEGAKPPTIYGVRDRSVERYTPFSLTTGVYAVDAAGDSIDVHTDLAERDLSEIGIYPVTYTATDAAGNQTTATANFFVRDGETFYLPVENILQLPALPNGCEVVSLAILLGYYGYPVDPVELSDKYLFKSSPEEYNPFYVYYGDPKSTSGGYGCYAPCIADTGTRFLRDNGDSRTVKDVSYRTFAEYEAYIDRGIPVILWGTLGMRGSPRISLHLNCDGETVLWRSESHCMVMIGHTADTYLFCDPLVAGITEYPKANVEASFDLVYRQACILE